MIELLPAIVGAIVVGLTLGLLGSGGSILCVPLLVYLVGRSDKQAIAESLAIVGLIALFGAAMRAREGDVRWRVALAFAPASMLGAWGGSYAANWIPGPAQLAALGALMLVAAALMLRRPKKPARAPRPRSWWWFALVGFGVGAITGLVGVGGGFLIVPALILVAALPHGAAVGTSLALIAVNAGVSFATYAATQRGLHLSGTIIAIFAVAGAAGTIGGRAIGKRLGQEAFKRVFAVFLLVLGVFMVVREGARAGGGDAGRGSGEATERRGIEGEGRSVARG